MKCWAQRSGATECASTCVSSHNMLYMSVHLRVRLVYGVVCRVPRCLCHSAVSRVVAHGRVSMRVATGGRRQVCRSVIRDRSRSFMIGELMPSYWERQTRISQDRGNGIGGSLSRVLFQTDSITPRYFTVVGTRYGFSIRCIALRLHFTVALVP